MKFSIPSKFLLAFSIFSLLSSNILANENSYNQARILQQEGKYDEAQSRNDHLGVLNSLNTVVDIFLYWNVAEYADIYANEAIQVEKKLESKNPMISAQTYINKGRALLQLGRTDSIAFYIKLEISARRYHITAVW